MSDNDTEAIHLVLGLDGDGKSRAARFPATEAKAARRAAKLMGFGIVEVTDEAMLALSEGIPQGRIYATGRALVPYVKRELYDKLLALLPEDLAPAAAPAEPAPPEPAAPEVAEAAASPAEPPAPVFADHWAAIEVGSVVLALDKTTDDGYWACEILEVGKDPNKLKAKWVNYPEEGTFPVDRRAVAVFQSGVAPANRK